MVMRRVWLLKAPVSAGAGAVVQVPTHFCFSGIALSSRAPTEPPFLSQPGAEVKSRLDRGFAGEILAGQHDRGAVRGAPGGAAPSGAAVGESVRVGGGFFGG